MKSKIRIEPQESLTKSNPCKNYLIFIDDIIVGGFGHDVDSVDIDIDGDAINMAFDISITRVERRGIVRSETSVVDMGDWDDRD
jgi:hypothetical protein